MASMTAFSITNEKLFNLVQLLLKFDIFVTLLLYWSSKEMSTKLNFKYFGYWTQLVTKWNTKQIYSEFNCVDISFDN